MERLPIQAGNWDQLLHFLGAAHRADGSLEVGYDLVEFGAALDGRTDDATAVNSAITAINAAGGGALRIDAGKTCAIAATVTLKNDVVVELEPGAHVKWTGTASGTMFTGGAAAPLLRSGVTGGVLDANAMTGKVFDLHSPQFCRFKDFEVLSQATTGTTFAVTTDSAAATGGYQSLKTAVFNEFRNIVVNQTGTLFTLTGATGQPVTLNEFGDIVCLSCSVRGIDLVDHCDNNRFTGYWDIQLAADNAIGLYFNSGADQANAHVYANTFDYLAIDAFTTFANRIDVKFGKSAYNVIAMLHCFPEGEGGVVSDVSADSYSITARTSSGYLEKWSKAMKNRAAPGGHYNLPDATYPIRVFTSGDVEAFNVKGADGTVTAVGPIIQKAGIYATNATDKLIDTTRKTGWTAATNTKARTTFDTATVSTPQLAARVAALIDDLLTHGLIGT